ncbi:hypothetical protein BBK82_27190 [Lentzea guizhouensis]|uniref:Uncharacterized protein n=1 Tax=Lentzea guizhouensis TaxID=1586287 RepID=A0A1B2HNA1_9PSEU|nr:hypothetical protein [Lentzea guizhouensis]ANZ39207.1 hypothetical protein BBK82_27190 [Lentzea guizhouensis]
MLHVVGGTGCADEQAAHDPERQLALEEAPRGQHGEPVLGGQLAGGGQQRGLADPEPAGRDDEVPVAVRRRGEGARQLGRLPVPPDQSRFRSHAPI